MKRTLWYLLILVMLVIGGCNGGEINDVEPLAIESTIPIKDAYGVTASESFSFIFNNEINSATVQPSSFTVECGPTGGIKTPLAGFTVSSTSKTVAIKPPSAGWPPEETCTVSAKGGYLKDVNDSVLATTAYYSFTTKAGTPIGTLSLLPEPPIALIADGSSTSTVTATLSNIGGKSGPAIGVPITFTATLGTITPAVVLTNSAGQATTIYTAGKAAGIGNITAVYGTLSKSVAMTLSAAVPSTLDVAFNKAELNPGTKGLVSSKSTKIYGRVKDSKGNLLSNYPVSFSLTANLSGATLGEPTATDASGWAEVTYTAGVVNASVNDIVTVSVGGLPPMPLTITVQPQTVGSVALDPTTTTLAADGNSTTFLTVTVLDTEETPIANKVVTLSINSLLGGKILTPDADANPLTGHQVLTNSSGTAKINYQAGITSGQYQLTVTCGTISAVAPIELTGGSLIVGAIDLTYQNKSSAIPTTLVSGGQPIKIYARAFTTAAKTIVAANAEATVSFPGVDDNQSGAIVTPLTAKTDTEGYVVFTYTPGIVASAKTDRVTVKAGGSSAVATFNVKAAVASIKLYYNDLSTAVPAATDPINYILTASNKSTTLFAQAFDDNGNVVPNVAISFGFELSGAPLVSNNKSGAAIAFVSATTNALGIAQSSYQAGITTGVDDVVTVKVVGGTVSSTAKMKVDPTVASIDFDKSVLFVGDSSSTDDTLTFTVRDALGRPIPDCNFQIVSSGRINPAVTAGRTMAAGLTAGTYTLLVSNSVMENGTLTVTAGGFSKTINVYAGATLSITPATANAVADGIDTLTYTAVLRDYNNVVLPNVMVSFVGKNDVLLNRSQQLTNASGQASVDVTSTKFTPTDADPLIPTYEVTATAGGLSAKADAIFEPGPAKTIVLSVPAAANPLSLGGSTTITAVVTDALGNPVKAGTVVTFTLNSTIGSVTGQAVTANATGTVTATFQAGMKAGTVTVTATSGVATGPIGLTVRPSDAGIIELSGVEPATKMINIRGSGLTQSATIYFIVKDGAGNPVEDKTSVYFTLSPPATDDTVGAGGEAIATTAAFAKEANGTTVNGIASVTLRSGILARTIGVVARVITSYTDTNADGNYDEGEPITGSISTEGRVTIVGGKPDSRHISLSAENLNVAGGVTFGLQNNITAYLGDRFSNMPIDGTPVSFYSECGTIGDGTGFVLSSVAGQVVAKMTTQRPTTPNLAGINGLGNVGVCTILTALPGEEYYIDVNADGVYAAADGDICSGDQGEPYIDGNDNDSFDIGEFFIDTDNDGVWDAPDGECSSSTMIWTDMNIMISATATPLNVTPGYFNIPLGGMQEFYVNLADIFGNSPVAGTKLTISADGGTLGGMIEYTVPDMVGLGNWYSEDSNSNGVLDANDRGIDINGDGIPDPGAPIRFWLSADTKADSQPKGVKITITRTPAPASTAGTDGIIKSETIGGMINASGNLLKMTVSSDVSTVSSVTGTAKVTTTLTYANGAPAAGEIVNFYTNPAGLAQYGTFTYATNVTNDAGQVVATYTAGTKAGFVDLVAAVTAGYYVTSSTAVHVLSSSAAKVTLSLSDSEVTAGAAVTANALVQDVNDNPVSGQLVTFSAVTNSSGGSFSPLTATTNSFGIASATYTAGSALPTAVDSLRASVAPTTYSDATLTVHSPAVAAASITVNLATATLVAGGTATTTADAFVADALAQPVEGVEVLFTTDRGSIAPVKVFTNGAGLATATLTAGITSGPGTVTASAVAGSLTDTAGFTLTPGPAAALFNPLVSPGTVQPLANSTISVRVVDANNNPVIDGTVVTFEVTTNNSGGSLGSTSATTLSGNASVVYTAGTTQSTDKITIRSNSAASVTVNVNVNNGLLLINAMTITASPLILSNNGMDVSIITAKVTKAGVPVADIDISFAHPEGTGDLFTVGGEVYSGAITTNSDGEAQIAFKPGALGRATVTSSFGAFTKAVVITTIDKVAQIVLTSDSPTIVANGTATTNVTATVLDINGGPLSGIILDNFTTTRGALSGGPYVTNASGQVTANLTATTMTGTALVTANYGAITDTEPVQFVVGPPATVTMNGSPTTLPYGAQTSLTVEVRDAQTRPVPNANLYFGFDDVLPGTGNASGGSYSLTSGTTDAQGRLTLSYTSGSVTANDTLLVETEETGVNDTLVIVVNPTTAAIGNMILAAPTFPAIVANGVTTTQLDATVTDSLGAPMNGVPVSFATTSGAIDADGTPQTRTVTTNASGKATVTLTSTTTIGTAYVTAVTGGFQGQQRVDFIPGIPVWKNAGGIVVSSLTPTSSALAADNVSNTEVKAVLKDTYGNLVADGTSVTLLSTLGTIQNDPAPPFTNPATTVNGVATFIVTATRTAGTSTLSLAGVPGLTSVIEFGVNNGANIGGITLTSTLDKITVAGAGQPSNTTVTIAAFESDGTPIDESFWGANNTIRVEFLNHPGGAEFVAGIGGVCSDTLILDEASCLTATETWLAGQQVSTATNAIDIRTLDGVATVTIQAGTLPGVIELKATALDETGAVTAVTASLTTIISAGPPHSIVLVPGTPQAPTSTTNLVLRPSTVIATDRFGNAVPDGTVLNLGIVDTILASGTGDASTNGNSLGGTYNLFGRAVAANDRVLITNAAQTDRNRFVATGTNSPFTVSKNFNNVVVGGLNAYIGAAIQGGHVTGSTGEVGWTTTTGGVADMTVSYANALTMLNAGAGYGCAGLIGTQGVFVVVSSSDGAVTTINQGGFCYAP